MTPDEIAQMFRETTPDSTGLSAVEMAAICDDLDLPDREPQPGDGPEYRADHAWWVERNAAREHE